MIRTGSENRRTRIGMVLDEPNPKGLKKRKEKAKAEIARRAEYRRVGIKRTKQTNPVRQRQTVTERLTSREKEREQQIS